MGKTHFLRPKKVKLFYLNALPLKMNVSIYGERVFTELSKLHFLLFNVNIDNSSHNKHLADAREQRKIRALSQMRESILPHLPEGANPDDFIKYEEDDPTEKNANYTAILGDFIGEMVLCRAVDYYHWYLHKVVRLIFTSDPPLIRKWGKKLGIKDETQLATFERGEAQEKLLKEWFFGRESLMRKLVHKHWNVPLKSDFDVLVKVRNCIVHGIGHDAGGKIASLVRQKMPQLLTVKDGKISVGFSGADLALTVIFGNLSLIDQCLIRTFSLDSTPHIPPKLNRVFG